jgi:hypothetical protein
MPEKGTITTLSHGLLTCLNTVSDHPVNGACRLDAYSTPGERFLEHSIVAELIEE